MKPDQDAVRSFFRIIPSLRKEAERNLDLTSLQGEAICISLEGRDLDVYLHKSMRKKSPALLVLHGGGFVLGDVRQNDALCQKLRQCADITVIGINYRLAPENPYPAAVNDVYDTAAYLCRHSEAFGIDPERIGFLGFSAGATLAAAACMRAAKQKDFIPRVQTLIYPYLDAVTPPWEKPEFPDSLPVEIMQAFSEAYCEKTKYALPEVSPLYAPPADLAGMPPTLIVTAALDSLEEEGSAYGALLQENGVYVQLYKMPHGIHGFVEDAFSPTARENMTEGKKARIDPHMWTEAEDTVRLAAEFSKKYL